MGSHRGVFAWYLALWLVLALAPAAYAVFGVRGVWKRVCEVLTPVSVEAGKTIRPPAAGRPGIGIPVSAREDEWLTHPVRVAD